MKTIKHTLKFLIPGPLKRQLKKRYLSYQIKKTQLYQNKALEKIRKKERIKIVFFVCHHSVWKYDTIYFYFDKHQRFEPIVFVCPYISYGDENMFRQLNQTYTYFKSNNYRVVNSYNKKTGIWLNVKKQLQPDVVFFSSSWNISRPEYSIGNFKNTLTCYVPYGFKVTNFYENVFNMSVQNFVWKFFLETEYHKQLSEKYSQNKSRNGIVTGYPGMDNLLDKNFKTKDVWKIKDRKIKRIIWAPHHTIDGMGDNLDFSTFYDYHELMFELAEKYKKQIQIAFKPHPTLRGKLSKKEAWGKIKTDNYFEQWDNIENGFLIEGNYIDLFATSDAMIHDSTAFIIEYLYANKPVMFLAKSKAVFSKLNEIGKQSLSNIYIGKNKADIIEFIENIVLTGNDFLKTRRVEFFNSRVVPPNNKMASISICERIEGELLKF